jgi:hypothetical protein
MSLMLNVRILGEWTRNELRHEAYSGSSVTDERMQYGDILKNTS